MFVILSYDNESVKEKLVNRSSFLERRPKVWWSAILLIVLPVAFLARAADPREGGTTPVAVIGIALVMVALVVGLVQLGRMLAGNDPDVPRLAEGLVSDPGQRRLLSRWMLRARRARNIGGVCGLVVWTLGTSAQGDLLLCGVGGIALGAMIAELHSVRPRRGPRTATLDVRRVGHYLADRDRNRMLGVAAAAVVLCVTAVAIDGLGTSVWCGGAALGVLGAAHAVQRRVAARPRPAIGASLRHADDLARELAIGRGLARPATYFGLALLARGAFSFGPDAGDIGTIVGVAAWMYALGLWWRNRRLGLDFLLQRPGPAPAPAPA
jgi:hypothetical protein